MKKLLILIIILVGACKVQAQQVSFSVQGDGDDWQLYMSSKLMADLNSGGKMVFITLTAGDEGHGNTSFNGSTMPYYLARERGGISSAKFANDIVQGNPQAIPVSQTVIINGHSLVKYVYKNTVSYFLRLPDGNTNGNGFSTTGNVSLKKLKDGTIGSLSSVDGNNTYTGWANLTSTIEAIINAEKGSNNQVWLNTGSLDATANPNDHSDHIYSSTAAQDAVNGLSWVGINEFINDHSSNLSPNLGNGVFQTASGLFSLSVLALIENNYPTKFTATNKAWLPMDYYTVKRSPSACAIPGGLTSSSITNTDATVGWTATAGALSYDVDYKLNTSSTWTNAATATAATSVAIGGLTPAMLYDWRVRSNCSNGSGIYAEAQFTITASCNAPTGLVSSAITLNSATVGWSAVSDAASYDVDYKLASASTWITSATATNAVSTNLTGLEHTSLYDWRVRANCTAFGLTSIYAQAQFTTLTATCIAPTGLVSSAITLNSATISWTATSGPASYDVDYKLNTSSTWTSAAIAIVATSIDISGLTESSLYDWRVRANCTAVGLTSTYTQAQFSTLTPPSCNAPTGLVSSNITATAATVSWAAVSGAASYDVDYKLNTSSTWTSAAIAIVATSIDISGLTESSLYDWRGRANCTAVGLTSVYTQAQFSTLTPPSCNAPTGLVSSNITATAATVSWAAVSGAASYDVDYKLNTSSTWTSAAIAIVATSIDISGLTESSLYDWRVRANCTAVGLTSTYTQAQFSTLTPPSCNAPTGLVSSNITATAATVSWAAVSGAASYDVDYKLNTSSTWTSAAIAIVATSIDISGLTESSLYDWRVRANCTAVGLTSTYTQAQFSTLAPPNCNAPTGLASSAITGTGATVSWTAVSGAANYTVEYKLESSATWTVLTATTAVTRNLTDLINGSVYDWRVQANCTAIGSTSTYAEAQFTTLSCNAPTGLASSNITTTTATVSWDAVNGAASYRVEYKLASSATWVTAVTASTTTTRNLTGLVHTSLYDWRVRANCTTIGLNSAFSDAQFTTIAPSCNAPTNPASSAITINSATVSWSAVSGAANYTVEYKLESSPTWITAVASTTATSRNITGLTHSSVYDWRVRANCTGVGLTSAYIQAQFVTLVATCNAPTGLTTTNITATGATVSWTAVSGAVNYTVEYKLASSATWTVLATTATLTRNLTGLTGAFLYDWRVRSNCTVVGLTSIYTQSQFTTACVDILEANETYATARAINVNKDYTAQIATTVDNDYYKFTNTAASVNIRVRLTNLSADYDLRLYNTAGVLIQTSQNRGTGDEEIIYNSLVVGTYRVYVYGINGAFSNTQCYTLRVDISDAPFTAGSNFGNNTSIAGKNEDAVIENSTSSINKETRTLRAGEMKVYPVSASSIVTVSFDAFAKGNTTLIISDQLGQEVMRKTVGVDNGINITSLNVDQLKSGVYLIKVNNGTGVQAKKLVIAGQQMVAAEQG